MGIQIHIIPAEKKNKKETKSTNIVVYNWLKTLNLISNEIDSLAKSELKVITKRISHISSFIVGNKDLFENVQLNRPP